jgi:hypothetical protein
MFHHILWCLTLRWARAYALLTAFEDAAAYVCIRRDTGEAGMVKRPASVVLAVATLVVMGVVAAPRVGASTAGRVVEAVTRISSDPYTNTTSQHKTQVEPDTFSFGKTIVSAFQTGRFFNGGASNIGWATSKDGGSTWTHGFMPGTTTLATPAGVYDRISDPSVAYDAKHHTWLVSTIALTNVPRGVAVITNRSSNGGTSWTAPTVVRAATGTDDLDKNWTVCDNTATSPFYGHCYTQWDNFGNINLFQMSTSTNGGRTWSAPSTSPDRPCVLGGQPLVQPNGTVIVPITDCVQVSLLSIVSKDGGRTWSRVHFAAQTLSSTVAGHLRTSPLPSAEIDKNGKVYVVWQDCRFEAPNCAYNDIVMSTSTDGVHWSLVKRVPADPLGSGVDHFIPGLAVDKSSSGAHARLGLAFYYYPNATCTDATCQLDVGFVSSTNGGASWSAKQQLAGPMNVTWLAATSQGFMVGDYISISIAAGEIDATPVFAIAHPPTAGVFDEAIYTTSGPLTAVTGGNRKPDGTPNTVAPRSATAKTTTTPRTAR